MAKTKIELTSGEADALVSALYFDGTVKEPYRSKILAKLWKEK
jgi:hypothetical protein